VAAFNKFPVSLLEGDPWKRILIETCDID